MRQTASMARWVSDVVTNPNQVTRTSECKTAPSPYAVAVAVAVASNECT